MNKYKIKFTNGTWTEITLNSYQDVFNMYGELHVQFVERTHLSDSS